MSIGTGPAGAALVGSVPSSPSPATVLAVAEAAGWPRARIHTLELEGEAAWNRVLTGCPRPAPVECRMLAETLGAPWVSDAMTATAPARARLARWFAAGRPTPTAEEIRRRLLHVGDDEIREIILQALARIPAPAVELVLSSTWVFSTGWSSNGWVSAPPPMPADPPEPLRIVLVGGHRMDVEETASIFGHEVGHLLTLRPATAEDAAEPPAERAERHEYITKMAVNCGKLDDWIESSLERERWAAACARSWGFTGSAADGSWCVRRTRAGRLADAAALPPL